MMIILMLYMFKDTHSQKGIKKREFKLKFQHTHIVLSRIKDCAGRSIQINDVNVD